MVSFPSLGRIKYISTTLYFSLSLYIPMTSNHHALPRQSTSKLNADEERPHLH